MEERATLEPFWWAKREDVTSRTKMSQGSLGNMSSSVRVKDGRIDRLGSKVIVQGHGVVWTQSELWTPNYPKRHGSEVIRCLHNSSNYGAKYQSKHGLQSTLSTPGGVHLHSVWIDYSMSVRNRRSRWSCSTFWSSYPNCCKFLRRSARLRIVVYRCGSCVSSQMKGSSHRSACGAA